jgi:hypothetical protein
MGASISHFIKIYGTHDMALLPQDARTVLNGIRSQELSAEEIYGVHGIWAGPRPEHGPRPAGPGLGPGPDRARTGPGQPWAQARPHGFLQQKASERIPFRAALAYWGRRGMSWMPSTWMPSILLALIMMDPTASF